MKNHRLSQLGKEENQGHVRQEKQESVFNAKLCLFKFCIYRIKNEGM